ncbi:hypothetical protein ACL598_16900 [Bordetella bronchialis]|uniref:hypothetical protein n=1 Tax=Bordetella bronchialis TaxID=463025 RepID=UPI003CFFBC40
MLEAMWTLRYERPGVDRGAGVMVLESGRLFGGDSGFSYLGEYRVENGQLIAKVHVSRHSSLVPNIFGRDEVQITLTGAIGHQQMTLIGAPVDMPQAKLVVIATRKADLP